MEWKHLFNANILNGGQYYLDSNSVTKYNETEGEITADVSGLEVFHVKIAVANKTVADMSCSCAYAGSGNNCKHMAAVLFAYDKYNTNKNNDDMQGLDDNASIAKMVEINEPDATSVDNTGKPEVTDESADNVKVNYDGSIEMTADVGDVFSYSLQQNDVTLVRLINLKNTTSKPVNDLKVYIYADIDLFDKCYIQVDEILPGDEVCIKKPGLMTHVNYLTSLSEVVTTILYVKLIKGNEEIASFSSNVDIFPFDQWLGYKYYPDLLAAFVTPNNPALKPMMVGIGECMKKWTGRSALDAYQSKDSERAMMFAAAAYAEIQKKDIIYSEPKASFVSGQKIRMIDEVLSSRLGTCMDMTLLYVALLENIGLHPIMVLKNGHIFAGVWLHEDGSFENTISNDVSEIVKRSAEGIDELILVECTAMCADNNASFDMAVAFANSHLVDGDDFELAIDVNKARQSKIYPVPLMVKGGKAYEVAQSNREVKSVEAPKKKIKTIDLSTVDTKTELTKQMQWERKLLDLSIRNMLINMRLKSAVVSLLVDDLSNLENSLDEGTEFEIAGRPVEWDLHEIKLASMETLNDLGPYSEMIGQAIKKKRLHTWDSASTSERMLTKIFRATRSSMEENGASTLYLALGMLRWCEGGKNSRSYYAPVILVPINIIRKSATKGYYISKRDDDVQINVTLLEFLKQDFGIEINGLNPLPKDEHGIDVDKIFAIIRRAVMKQTSWDVIENAFIGNFSFSQFVMWNDIHSRSDLLEKNRVVHGLINGAVDWDCTIPKDVDTDDAYLPVSVDSSQLRAINMAANDVSFVLHGPPGTGKSQTITGMIANALSKGKTVLFVAEKMAALSVVQKRLESLGIGDFCLELHSNKAVKKNVLSQLSRALDIKVWGLATDYDEKIEEIHQMRSSLDSYAKKLHEIRPFGISIREMMDMYETLPEAEEYLRLDKDMIRGLTLASLEKQKAIIEHLNFVGDNMTSIRNNPCSIVGLTEYSLSLRVLLREALASYESSINDLIKVKDSYINKSGQKDPVSKQEWTELFDFGNEFKSFVSMPAFVMDIEAFNKTYNDAAVYIDKREHYKKLKDEIILTWKETAFDKDFSGEVQRYYDAQKKFLFKKKLLEELKSELSVYTAAEINLDELPGLVDNLRNFQDAKKSYIAAEGDLSEYWKEVVTDSAGLADIEEIKTSFEDRLSASSNIDTIRSIKEKDLSDEFLMDFDKLTNAYNVMITNERELIDLLKLGSFENDNDYIGSKKDLIDGLGRHSSELKDWIEYQSVKAECASAGILNVCDAYEDGLKGDELINAYVKSVYKELIWMIIEEEPVLNRFVGNSFNDMIRQYKKLEQDFLDLTKEEMYFRLTHNLPTGRETVEMSKELAILRKAITSGGRGLSIRNLFDQIPHVLRKVCPCLLMSPISVAQYLSVNNDPYDIIIFDEASQLPTCKAVGVLARGRNSVIVGDPNQMPPTSFFAGNTVDDENIDLEDLDSILDDCLALGMPQTHLKWHYRSKHESLIAFSNQEYYDNSMHTFPSVNDRERRVKLCTVNGTFDRKKGRINEAEGKAVVNEIIRRYKNPNLCEKSIGIVTFNISQQNLIQNLLYDEFKNDEGLEKWATEKEEALFVKNLENVQGDERDVILFSIGFGPDETGRISMNFGPLNKEGGWRRLNVAVSRARSEMIVFSSMTYDMIDLNRTQAKGVEGLRSFLEFAQRGRLHTDYVYSSSTKYKGIQAKICEELEKAGYKCQKNVGHSDYKVDIGVLNPYNDSLYMLGILLDGDSYKQTANTKDRELSQENVLSGLGWHIHRMWAMDWWDSSDREIRSLLQLLKKLDQSAKDDAKKANNADDGPVSEEIVKKEVEVVQRGKKKKGDEPGGKISSFSDKDRFSPIDDK